MWHYYDYYGPMHAVSGLFSVLWWILVIWAVIAFVRWLKHDGKGRFHLGTSSALDILKERYAKGEIDKAEFEEKKKDLEK